MQYVIYSTTEVVEWLIKHEEHFSCAVNSVLHSAHILTIRQCSSLPASVQQSIIILKPPMVAHNKFWSDIPSVWWCTEQQQTSHPCCMFSHSTVTKIYRYEIISFLLNIKDECFYQEGQSQQSNEWSCMYVCTMHFAWLYKVPGYPWTSSYLLVGVANLATGVILRRGSPFTSQISHLLLRPSLWLLVPGLSSQFLPCFPIQPFRSPLASNILEMATRFGKLREPPILQPVECHERISAGKLWRKRSIFLHTDQSTCT